MPERRCGGQRQREGKRCGSAATILVSGYVFVATLAAPGVLFASEGSKVAPPGEATATPPGEATATPPGAEAPPPEIETGATEPPGGETPVQEPTGGATGPPPPTPAADAPEASVVDTDQGRPQRGSSRRGGGHKAVASATRTVAMRNIEFQPRNITIDPGDTVRWENQESAPHNAIGEDDSFRTPVIDKGETSQHTFQRSGRYPYFCSIHAGMDGTITVRGSGSGGSGSGASGSGAASGDTSSSAGSTGTSGAGASGVSGAGSSGTFGTGSGSTTGSSSGSTLPATGLDVLWLGLIGSGLLTVGAALALLAPRDT
jgi:plastocyanin